MKLEGKVHRPVRLWYGEQGCPDRKSSRELTEDRSPGPGPTGR